MQIMDFFIDPQNFKIPKGYKETEFVILTEDKKIFTCCDPRKWLPVKDKHYAIGSGSHFAMGAMQAGKNPEEAVKVAMKLDKGTGFGVTKVVF
jgi:ATP-dependent protease HslVU (ClpYQ) peptidase subunit